jgi:hypothetical protein
MTDLSKETGLNNHRKDCAVEDRVSLLFAIDFNACVYARELPPKIHSKIEAKFGGAMFSKIKSITITY